jgi:hypothetical protein
MMKSSKDSEQSIRAVVSLKFLSFDGECGKIQRFSPESRPFVRVPAQDSCRDDKGDRGPKNLKDSKKVGRRMAMPRRPLACKQQAAIEPTRCQRGNEGFMKRVWNRKTSARQRCCPEAF